MAYMNELIDRARHRISIGDCHRMAGAGVFGHQDRVELIAGEVFDMTPIGSQNAYVVNQLARLFRPRSAAGNSQRRLTNRWRAPRDSD